MIFGFFFLLAQIVGLGVEAGCLLADRTRSAAAAAAAATATAATAASRTAAGGAANAPSAAASASGTFHRRAIKYPPEIADI